MICVIVEICDGVLTRRMKITAPSIERAMEIAGDGKLGRRRARLLFPIDPDAFFTPEDSRRREAA